MAQVFVAAGGGGDALATAIVHEAINARGEKAVIATYAWDRLLIDPIPGPRPPSAFRGLEAIGQHNFAVAGGASAIPPAASTLPRLARAVRDTRLVVLDPRYGAVGMRRQVQELVELYRPERVKLLDVGGDVLTQGDEPALRSPLADGLAAAACANLTAAVDVLIAGPGLDGELGEHYVRERVLALGGELAVQLGRQDVERFLPIFEWHPSEVTALLAAAACGIRGTVEVRDAGLAVILTPRSGDVYRVDHQAVLAASPVARAVLETASWAEVERRVREVCGFSELDHERAKAATLNTAREPLGRADLDDRARRFEAEAASRGIDYVTFRRLAEALNLSGAQWEHLRSELVSARPDQYSPPLWAVRPHRPREDGQAGSALA